jgi:MFS family permease
MRSWYTLGLLCILYIVSFVDRMVIASLVEPLKASFGFSDTQIGILQGAAFGFFYGVFGIPLARVADLYNRRNLIVIGAIIWGVATAFSAFATGFAMLFLLRIGVAIGEAALSPAALSMLSDSFNKSQRATAGSIYVGAGLVGSFLTYVVVGFILETLGVDNTYQLAFFGALSSWQLVFVLVGIPSVVLAVVIYCTVREPARQGTRAADKPSTQEVFAELRNNSRLYVALLIGGGLLAILTSSLSAWMPTILTRTHGLGVAEASLTFGKIGIAASLLGTILIPYLGETLARRGNSAGLLQVYVGATLLGTPLLIAVPFTASIELSLSMLALATFFFFGAVAVPILAIQQVALPRMRATITASLFFMKMVIGYTIGPVLTALLSDYLFPGSTGLGLALAALTALIGPLTAILVLYGRHAYAQTAAQRAA